MANDKIEQLKSVIKAKKDAEARVQSAAEQGGIAPGLEDQYRERIAELEAELEKAQIALAESEAKSADAQEKYVRAYAEFDNTKKRFAKEKDESLRYAHERMVKDLLPVLDGLEQALAHAETSDKKAIVEGVQLVLRQFLKALEGYGVTQVPAIGHFFDPHHHEAVGQQESEEHEPDSVVNEYRRGYKMHDRLIRPSMVTVAKPPEGKK